MELKDFPVDIQDLTICLSTKHSSRICKLIPDSNKFTVINNQKYSALNDQVIKTFRDQQKFSVNIFFFSFFFKMSDSKII